MTDTPSGNRPSWIIWLPLALFGLITGAAIYALSSPSETEIRSTLVGKPLPQFALEPAVAGGAGLSSADFTKGEPRLLNIFASWCAPCEGEAPQLEKLKERGVKIDGVAIRDKPEDVAQFLSDHGNPYVAIGADPKNQMTLLLGASGVPETFVVDGRGIIRYQHLGPIAPEHIPALLAELDRAR